MSRKLATIQIIKELKPIPNADQIEVASILGWHVVVKKGQFTKDQLVTYCEVDSLLPVRAEFEFLRKSCYKKNDLCEGFRIRTVRLRGALSQGICFPTSILGSGDFKEGDDVTELLGVEKYVYPIPANLAGLVKGTFSSFIPKTDETRVQVLQHILTRHKGTTCYLTEKIDGTSATYFIKDGEFGVCSRSLWLKETADNSFWKLARELKVEEKLRNLNKNIAIQGELIGIGVQANRLKLKENKVLFFNAFDIDSAKYYDYEQFKSLIESLGLETVPVLRTDFVLIDDVDALVELAKGNSSLNETALREGIVIRPLIEKNDAELCSSFGNGRLSFKTINNDYLLKYEE